MKIKYLHTFSTKLTSQYTTWAIAAALCIVSLLCPSNGKTQTAYWLESINNNVKKQNVGIPPVSAGSANTLVAAPSIPMFIFEDDRNGFVYWSDAGTGTIKKVSTAGGAVTNVVTGITGAGIYPRGIYVDVTNNILYWAQTAPGLTDSVKKIDISGALPKASSSGSVVVSAIDIVRGITVDTVASIIYFVDAGTGGSGAGIYQASTAASVPETSSTKVAICTSGGQPNSLFIDRANHFIYWSDFAASGKIQRAATNAATFPTAAITVFTGTSIRGMSIDLGDNSIYWTEYPSLKIRKASLSTIPVVGATDVVTGLLTLPRNLQITSSLTAPPAIKSFTPPMAGKGQTVSIKGKHFTGANAVSFGNIPAKSFNVLTDTSIAAIVGAGAAGRIVVQNQYGKDSIDGFYYCATLTKLKATLTASPGNVICAGTAVTLTSNLVGDGTPVYHWYKNNVAVGANSNRYRDTKLASGDSVWCVITSNANCVVSDTVKSPVIKFTVNPKLTATIKITVSPGTVVCYGNAAIFNAKITNGGDNPVYQWKKNGIDADDNSPDYTDAVPQTGDSVICRLTSSMACVLPASIISAPIKLTVTNIPPPDQPSVIKGPASVTAGQQAIAYGVTKVAGVGYNWTVPAGATIVSGQGTYRVVINWGSADGNISVVATNPCGSSPARVLAVHVIPGLNALNENSGENLSAGRNSIRYYPNPVTNMLTVEFNAASANKYEAQVVNAVGQLVTSKTGMTVKGLNQVSFNMGGLASAMYYIRLYDEEHGLRTLKVIKVK